jgi:MTH538 TIR-like domain (DUF1863)
MAHRTFFSFYYEEDVQRASVVRNSGALKEGDVEFIDGSLWEEAKRQSDAAIRRLIDDALGRTTVTAVLIGTNTFGREWVNYEISESMRLGKGLLGVYIHNIPDFTGKTAPRGSNPVPSRYHTYDWVYDNGYKNLGSWVDEAYDDAN